MPSNLLSDILERAGNRKAAIRTIEAHYGPRIVKDTLKVKFEDGRRTASFELVSGGSRYGEVDMRHRLAHVRKPGVPSGISCPDLMAVPELLAYAGGIKGPVGLG